MSNSLQLTQRAAQRVQQLAETQACQDKPWMLRLTILGGGCSGFQYSFALDNNVNEDDVIFEEHGVKTIIDQASLEIAQASVIDYKESMMGSAFTVENPQAASSCGCGNSFSI